VSYYSGSDGYLKVDGTEAATVTTWSFSSAQETLDVTTLGDRDRQLIGGIRSLSGSASISWYSASTETNGDKMAQTLIGKIIKTTDVASSTFSLELGIKDHAQADRSITLPVIITGVSMTNSQGEILSADISFEATARPTALTLNEQAGE
tara:strand:+ start:4849 stop:5298 length:450 start_codon:yes stop_codon:yes gene_type:complete